MTGTSVKKGESGQELQSAGAEPTRTHRGSLPLTKPKAPGFDTVTATVPLTGTAERVTGQVIRTTARSAAR